MSNIIKNLTKQLKKVEPSTSSSTTSFKKLFINSSIMEKTRANSMDEAKFHSSLDRKETFHFPPIHAKLSSDIKLTETKKPRRFFSKVDVEQNKERT